MGRVDGHHEIVIAGGRVWSRNRLVGADIAIDGGRVSRIGARLDGAERVDALNLWVLPGAIDGHTHMEAAAFGLRSRDTFESGTRAAAAGGVTTILDFTAGSAESTLAEQVQARVAAARRAVVDIGLHAEIVGWRSDRAYEIAEAVRMGVTSFKFYTVYAERSSPAQLADAFRVIAAAGGVAMVHAEDAGLIQAATEALPRGARQHMTSFPRSRPAASEAAAVSLACQLAEIAGVRVHFAHLSTGTAVDVVRNAKARGLQVTAETCPHYLLLDQRAYATADGRQFSVIPPLRSPADQSTLWVALADRTIDSVATDHCPFARSEKNEGGDVLSIPCGLPGVETLLPLLHSEGVVARGLSLDWLVRALCESPARIFGLAPQKGRIEVGADADLVLFDPRRAWTLSASALHMGADFSPYEGCRVRGAVVRTLVRGRTVWADGECLVEPGWGRFVPRSQAIV